jgi:hypothetical protein
VETYHTRGAGGQSRRKVGKESARCRGARRKQGRNKENGRIPAYFNPASYGSIGLTALDCLTSSPSVAYRPGRKHDAKIGHYSKLAGFAHLPSSFFLLPSSFFLPYLLLGCGVDVSPRTSRSLTGTKKPTRNTRGSSCSRLRGNEMQRMRRNIGPVTQKYRHSLNSRQAQPLGDTLLYIRAGE